MLPSDYHVPYHETNCDDTTTKLLRGYHEKS